MTDMPAYTREEWDERARSIIRATQFDSSGVRNADITVGSDYDIWSRMLGAVGFLLQESGNSGRRALNKAQSFGAFLREHASIAGIAEALQAGAFATGKIAVRASTTASQTFTSGSVLFTLDGTSYTADAGFATLPWSVESFTSGERAKRDFVFHGTTAMATNGNSKLFEYAPTGELLVPRASGFTVPYRYCQPHVPLIADPAMADLFTRVPGVVANVTAAVAGSSGNREPRDLLFMTAWPGTFVSAQVLYIDGGRDALTASQMQQGLRDLYGTRLDVMTLEQIRRLALETPRTNLRQVYTYPSDVTGPSGDSLVMVVGQMRSIGTSYDLAAVTSYLNEKSLSTELFAGMPTAYRGAEWMITMRVSPDFAPDWKYSPTLAQAFDGASTTTRIQHTTALPAAFIAVGDRILVSLARGASLNQDPCLVERKVSAIGANYLDVSDPLPYAPTNAVVSQSGPFGDDLIAAVNSFFDNQAPFIANQYRYPSPDAVSAVDAFRAALGGLPGLVDLVVTEPLGPAVPVDWEVLYPKSITVVVWT